MSVIPLRSHATPADTLGYLRELVSHLKWETHPILALDVCRIEHDGDVLYIDEMEIHRIERDAADALTMDNQNGVAHAGQPGLRHACLAAIARSALRS